MNTRLPTIAGEDFTGPEVWKLQTSANWSGSLLPVAPVRAGPPRNIGHSPPGSAPKASQEDKTHSQTATCRVVFMGALNSFAGALLSFRPAVPAIQKPAEVSRGSPGVFSPILHNSLGAM